MSKYEDLAKSAAEKARTGIDPQQAWESAALEVFPTQKSSRNKGCPKGAFLGLAEEGMIRGIPAGNYTRSLDNKQYAVDAVSILKTRPELSNDPSELWKAVMSGRSKQHNEQMSVVIALWKSGDIQTGT